MTKSQRWWIEANLTESMKYLERANVEDTKKCESLTSASSRYTLSLKSFSGSMFKLL